MENTEEVSDKNDFKKPNIFITGPSGFGKSTSLRNLDPERTIVLDTECEQLPFPQAQSFKRKIEIESLGKFNKALDRSLVAEDCDVIVIESFTSLCELVHDVHITASKEDSFAGWQKYKNEIARIIRRCKVNDRYVVFIGIDDTTQDDQLRRHTTIAVQGSLKGKVEKEFQIVLWADVRQSEFGPEYSFITNANGTNKAKSPLGMFDSQFIPNDISKVIERIEEYYTGESENG